MLRPELDKVRRECPHIVAVFRVSKVPSWAENYVDLGDEVYWSAEMDSMRTLKLASGITGRMNLNLGASHVTFLRYEALK